MDKTICLGDTHGRRIWQEIVNREDFNRVVFIGDYFDSFDVKADEQINNFLDIIEFKKSSGKDVILLWGNHDDHYGPNGNTGTSGYQVGAAPAISHVITTNKEYLQMVYKQENFLFTHAGVGETFLNDIFGEDGWKIETLEDDLNELWKYKPQAFIFNGWEPSGDNIGQTPIWIRPLSLVKDSQNLKKQGIIQVVGHTQKSNILNVMDSYYFIDTLPESGEYLIIENGEVNIKHI